MREAARFLDFSLARGSTVIGVERRDAPRPTPETLREIVANAVAHRDYGINAPVQLRIEELASMLTALVAATQPAVPTAA